MHLVPAVSQLPDLALRLLVLVVHLVPAVHQQVVLQRGYRVPVMLVEDFHQHYLLQVPVRHQSVGPQNQRSFVAVHLGYHCLLYTSPSPRDRG